MAWRCGCRCLAVDLAWNEDEVIALFEEDPTMAAVAYPLRASNREHLWAQFQDVEYLTAGYMKIAMVSLRRIRPGTRVQACDPGRSDAAWSSLHGTGQARATTTLFASGAINTWRVDVIVDILFRHDTMHHGDDLQQGLILHSLKGKEWFIQTKDHMVHDTSYKVGVYEIAVTATDVPVHWFHSHDLWPRKYLKYVKTLAVLVHGRGRGRPAIGDANAGCP